MIIKYGEFLPDLPALNNPGCIEAINVVPLSGGGYREIPLPTEKVSTGMTAYCRGAYNGIFEGTSDIFGGDATKLYSVSGSSWVDESSGAYTAGKFWDFTQFGALVIAVNGGASGNNPPQVWDMATKTTGAAGDTFAALGGSPPNAACCAVVRQQVVLGHTYDATDGEVEDRVRWSGFGDAASWAVSAATQADFQDLNNGAGAVQRITGGAHGWVYQERAIWRMTYEGPPTVFRFDEVFPDIGCPAPMSVVQANGVDYLWSTIGFISIAPDGKLTPIGTNRVDRFVGDSLIFQVKNENIIGAHDQGSKSIVWLYGGSTAGQFTQTAVAYNYHTDQWYQMEFSLEGTRLTNFDDAAYIFSAQQSNQREQKLHIANGSAGTNDYGLYSLDEPLLGNVASMLGTITTGEMELTPGRYSMVGRIAHVTDIGGAISYESINLIHRSTQRTADTGLTTVAMTNNPRSREYTARVSSRFFRFQFSFFVSSGESLKVTGLDLREFTPGSRH